MNGSKDVGPSCAEPFEATYGCLLEHRSSQYLSKKHTVVFKSKLGVNSRMFSGLNAGASVSEAALGDAAPKPRGVNAGALAAFEVKVAFLPVAWRPAGVKDGDSTLRVFFELE
jgi:hypothetical protein